MNYKLSELWIKASITGTIWAASEIVLGSFLHNLQIPFSGNILTAIGLIILISISYIWTEKGLFWRAGLICALMKTMSPSAVIFGPMIAIFAESLLLELFVGLLGRTIAGYAVGAMFAMSWNLFQKIANYIILYGSNIAEVYSNLLKMAQKQLNIQTDLVWLPIIVLLILFALFGLISAIIGILVGRRMLNQPASEFIVAPNTPQKEVSNKKQEFNYSIPWLIINIALITGSFILLVSAKWIVWTLAITGVIIIWSLRYKRALRQLSKPKFWIFFVLITLVTAFVFAKVQSGENPLRLGLLTGLQMNFRAAVIIVGFAVVGTELYNPVIRNFFLRTSIKNLPLALELSAESLPSFIANIPEFRTLIKNPVSIFYNVISQADKRLSEIRKGSLSSRGIFIVSGRVGEGKTTYIKNLIDFLRHNNLKTGGIISERVMTGSRTTGYDIINIESGAREPFLREDEKCGTEKIGKFTICPEGLRIGNTILTSLESPEYQLVVIDEVGMLELGDKGWAGSLDHLLENSSRNLLIIVRDSFVDKVITRWNLMDAITFNIKETVMSDAGRAILEKVNLTSGN